LEIGVFEGGLSVSAKFSRRRKYPPRTMFARIDKPVNALQCCRASSCPVCLFFTARSLLYRSHFIAYTLLLSYWTNGSGGLTPHIGRDCSRSFTVT